MNTSLIQFHQTGNACHYTLTSEGKKCEFLQFLINTSNFAWRKKPEDVTEEDKQREASILLSKMCAIGYMLFHIKRPDNARAVILTDYMNAVPGQSGKSLFVEFMKYFVETTQISCRHIDITSPFFLNGISDKTKLVFLDDLQPNFKLEHLFPFITGDWPINREDGHLFEIPFRFSPKIILSTNYKIGGKGLSFDSRKWEIPFSDYYNANYSPFNNFKNYFFIDWAVSDWRFVYALVADCVQLFLEYGVVSVDLSWLNIEDSQLSNKSTSFFDSYFDNPENLNHPIKRRDLYELLCNECHNMRKQMSFTAFKYKIAENCIKRNIRLKTQMINGAEYFTFTRYNDK